MPRIKVSTPDNPRFRMERKVGISDLNYAKHLDSTAMVAILNEARLQMLGDLGFTEGNIYGLGLVVTDFAIEYRAESFANDTLVIDVSLWVSLPAMAAILASSSPTQRSIKSCARRRRVLFSWTSISTNSPMFLLRSRHESNCHR